MKQNKRHSKRFNTFLVEYNAIARLENRLGGLIEQIKASPKVTKLKEIADGVFFKGYQDDKAIIIVDGKEKTLKVNETKKGKFIRLNNISTYL